MIFWSTLTPSPQLLTSKGENVVVPSLQREERVRERKEGGAVSAGRGGGGILTHKTTVQKIVLLSLTHSFYVTHKNYKISM